MHTRCDFNHKWETLVRTKYSSKSNTIILAAREQQLKYQAQMVTWKNMFYGVVRRKNQIKANKSCRVIQQNDWFSFIELQERQSH